MGRERFVLGWGAAPKGDVELVIATLVLGKNLVSPDVFSSLILMAFFTTLISPIVFRYAVNYHTRKHRS